MIIVTRENNQTTSVSAVDLATMDVVKIDNDGTYHFLMDGASYSIQCTDVDFMHRTITLFDGTSSHRFKISDKTMQGIAAMGYQDRKQENAGDIKAPMPGMVLHIKVSEHQEVAEGDNLCILEAMKMENVIKAPIAGTITSLPIAVGQAVQKGDLLFVISPSL